MENRVCMECGIKFTINDGEISFYAQRGWDLPKRCAKCREARKKNSAMRLPGAPIRKNCSMNDPIYTNMRCVTGGSSDEPM